MIVKLLFLIFSLTTVSLYGVQAIGCTAAFLKHQNYHLLAANMDWFGGDGMIVVNKRGNVKSALTNPASGFSPARWKSRYGSVTFNQYAVDWPWAGINESGLVGSGLMMRWAEFSEPGQQPSIFIMQWLQYQLDNFSSVSEVVANVSKIQIRPVSSKNGVHHFFYDRTGDAAVIDIIDGKINVYRGDGLPVQAMANEPYASSLVYLKRIKGFGGTLPISDSNLSKDRFVRAADGIRQFSPENLPEAIDTAFEILDSVSIKSHPRISTQWQIVFELNDNRIFYRIKSHPTRKVIDLASFDFFCRAPIRVREIVSESESTATTFESYSYGRNRQHVEAFFRRHPLKPVEYESRVVRVTRYPETFKCSPERE